MILQSSVTGAPPRIHRLPPDIAEKIAAGEIIERPASVVKELLENSLDAGATEVCVTLGDGGKNLIEVLDNGQGMGPEDLLLSIERHATSKLSQLMDLENIQTLGFRGEALPSIAAVSEMSIVSRVEGAASAFQLTRGPGGAQVDSVTFGHFLHASHGTRIRCLGLFSQIPARLKFLKSSGAEVQAVREWMERLALAYPHVGFRLVHQPGNASAEKVVLDLRPQTLGGRVLSVLAEGEDYPLITAESEQDGFHDLGLKVQVLWVQGLSSPSTKRLVQVVNRRALRDRLLQQAILAPFRQTLLPGQFPAVALIMEINPAAIDVNVHPSKAEIRFLDTRKIFSTVDALVKGMIAQHGSPGVAQRAWGAASWGQRSELSVADSQSVALDLAGDGSSAPARFSGFTHLFQGAHSGSGFVEQSPASPQSFAVGAEQASQGAGSYDFGPQIALGIPPARVAAAGRLIGQFFQTYFMIERDGQVILVDQHAAHERVRYEALRKKVLGHESSDFHASSQGLLIPEVIRVDSHLSVQMTEVLPQLQRWGFDAEVFGDETLLFRGVPGEWGTEQLKPRLKNLVDRLMSSVAGAAEGSNVLMDEVLFESMASQACHSSVRAGDSLLPEEVQSLYEQLLTCEHPWNCPHGRPTMVTLTRSKIEDWFQR